MFFFSSRRRHTRYWRDWSSDVCSSDVVIRGVNDDELVDLIEFGKQAPAEVRFIEYMDVGGATRWSMDQVVGRTEVLEVLGSRYGRIEPVREETTAPADRYRLPDGPVC